MQTTSRAAGRPEEILRNLPHIDGVIPMYVDGSWRLGAIRRHSRPRRSVNGRRIATVAEGRTGRCRVGDRAARRAFDEGPWPSLGAPNARRGFSNSPTRSTRIATISRNRHAQQRQAAARSEYDASMPPRVSATTLGSPPSRTAKRSMCPALQTLPCANRSASRPDRSLEISAADGGLETRAWSRCRQRLVLKPAELTPLSAIGLRRFSKSSSFPPASSTRARFGPERRHAIAASCMSTKSPLPAARKPAAASCEPRPAISRRSRSNSAEIRPEFCLRRRRFRHRGRLRALRHLCNAGQVCGRDRAAPRKSLHDRFVERLAERAKKITLVTDSTRRRKWVRSSRRSHGACPPDRHRTRGARAACGG